MRKRPGFRKTNWPISALITLSKLVVQNWLCWVKRGACSWTTCIMLAARQAANTTSRKAIIVNGLTLTIWCRLLVLAEVKLTSTTHKRCLRAPWFSKRWKHWRESRLNNKRKLNPWCHRSSLKNKSQIRTRARPTRKLNASLTELKKSWEMKRLSSWKLPSKKLREMLFSSVKQRW